MVLAFEILTFFLTGALVFHCYKTHGRQFTLLFFITGFILGTLRENVVSLASNLYTYNADGFNLWIGYAPLVLGVFWSNLFYVSLSLSEKIAHGAFLEGKRVAAMILVSMVFAGAYAPMNEAMASAFPLVIWEFKPDVAIWGGAPLMVVFGYAGLCGIFLPIVYLIYRHVKMTWAKILLGALSTLVMIPLHLLWLAIVRLVIKLFA